MTKAFWMRRCLTVLTLAVFTACENGSEGPGQDAANAFSPCIGLSEAACLESTNEPLYCSPYYGHVDKKTRNERVFLACRGWGSGDLCQAIESFVLYESRCLWVSERCAQLDLTFCDDRIGDAVCAPCEKFQGVIRDADVDAITDAGWDSGTP